MSLPKVEKFWARFEFFSAAKDHQYYCLEGVVVVRDSEMVLDVIHPANFLYTIVGVVRAGMFQGSHEGDDVHHGPVSAKWVELGAIFVGTWIEDGIDFMFKITLPEA